MKKDLKKELEECQKQKEEYLVGWKRERADFINYKKTEEERINKIVKFANENLILKILSVLDNIYIAEKELPQKLEKNDWVKGILKIKEQILDFLRKEGIEEIKCLGENFNPNFHEAVESVQTKNYESGIIIEEIKKGYKLNGKVIRPAKVKVAK